MRKYLLAIFVLVAWVTNAQIKVTGIVKDSIGNPLEMANVIALNKKNLNVENYLLDHICYRTESLKQYTEIKNKFNSIILP